MTMRDTIARAICEADKGETYYRRDGECKGPHCSCWLNNAMPSADAVLGVLEKPAKEIVIAGMLAYSTSITEQGLGLVEGMCGSKEITAVFAAMIAAAKEGK